MQLAEKLWIKIKFNIQFFLVPIKWVPGALSLGANRPRREADHSPPSSAEVKE
jgi:hypothetical protein